MFMFLRSHKYNRTNAFSKLSELPVLRMWDGYDAVKILSKHIIEVFWGDDGKKQNQLKVTSFSLKLGADRQGGETNI